MRKQAFGLLFFLKIFFLNYILNKKIDIFKFMNNSLQSIKILYNKVRNIK